MKRLLIIITAVCLGPALVQAQDSELSKAEKKEMRKQQQAEDQQQLEALVRERSFLIDANQLQNRFGQSIIVNQNNFVKINGKEVILQTSFPTQVGANGLGGVTVVGEVIEYQINDDNNALNVVARISSPSLGQGILTINFTSLNQAKARFSGNWGQQITFMGPVKILDSREVFQGMTIN